MTINDLQNTTQKIWNHTNYKNGRGVFMCSVVIQNTYDITEKLLKVALNTITLPLNIVPDLEQMRRCAS
jgi:hypothetical protein